MGFYTEVLDLCSCWTSSSALFNSVPRLSPGFPAFFEKVANILHSSGSRPGPLHEGAESLQSPPSESR
jgi:hypothetical protein